MVDVLIDEPTSQRPVSVDATQDERNGMKLLTCILRPESVEAVKEALSQLQVVGGMTLTEVRGFGRQRGHVEHYRGGEYVVRFVPKVRLDVAIPEEEVDRVLTAVSEAARTGQVGDGKVFVVEMRNALRIRTGERGLAAL